MKEPLLPAKHYSPLSIDIGTLVALEMDRDRSSRLERAMNRTRNTRFREQESKYF